MENTITEDEKMVETVEAPATLQDFLASNTVENVSCKVKVSNRIPFDFEIKAMTETERENCRKRSYVLNSAGKKSFNQRKFEKMIILNQTVTPCFDELAFIQKVGAATPEDCLDKVLLSGEQDQLVVNIFRHSGFDISMNELIEQAKN